MKLANLDRHTNGSAPLSDALQWLDTLTRVSGPVAWNRDQLDAAKRALAEARELMATDVLTLAGRHFPNVEPVRYTDKAEGVMQRIDRVEREVSRDWNRPGYDTHTVCSAGEPGCNPANCVECPSESAEFVVPVHPQEGADWDELTKGRTPPWPVDVPYEWRRVVVYGAPSIRAHDLNDPAVIAELALDDPTARRDRATVEGSQR